MLEEKLLVPLNVLDSWKSTGKGYIIAEKGAPHCHVNSDGVLVLPSMVWMSANQNKIDNVIATILGYTYEVFENDEMRRWFECPQYRTGFQSFIMCNDPKTIYCDIETANLRVMDDNEVIKIGILVDGFNPIIISKSEFFPEMIETLQSFFSKRQHTFVWHNGKFDIVRLKSLLGINARVDGDTMLMHHCGINEKKGFQSLDELSMAYLGVKNWKLKIDEVKKKWARENKVKLADFQYNMLPSEILNPYLARDLMATQQLHKLFTRLMRPSSKDIYQHLINASNVYAKIELNGFNIDTLQIKQLENVLTIQTNEVETKLKELVGVDEINLNSPIQLKAAFSKMGIFVSSTQEDALILYRRKLKDGEENDKKKEVIDTLLELRKLNKQLKTYVIGFQKQIYSDGKIHSSFKLAGTQTGRLASGEPK